MQNREDATFNEMLKHIPIYNYTLYIKHDRENNTFLLKEDEKKFEKDQVLLNYEAVNAKLN